MPPFISPKDYITFAEHVIHSKRYIHDAKANRFLETLLNQAQQRVESIPGGSILWRAQLGCDEEPLLDGDNDVDGPPYPLPSSRMIPPRQYGREGRIQGREGASPASF